MTTIKTPSPDSNLIGLCVDDQPFFAKFVRCYYFRDVDAQIPYYASSNEDALRLLNQITSTGEHLDFIATDIERPYGSGVEFIANVRSLPDEHTVGGGLRIKHIPMIVVTLGGYSSENIQAIQRIDPHIPVVSKHADADSVVKELIEAIAGYRHRLLKDFERLGLAVYWSDGRYRIAAAYRIPKQLDTEYFAGPRRRLGQTYSRLVLVLDRSRTAEVGVEVFEKLLNDRKTTERDFQALFERYPQFLLGDQYDSYWSQPIIVSPRTEKAVSPDFVLQPHFFRTSPWTWNIVELKRHDIDVMIDKRFHPDLSRQVYRAVTQLRDYSEFFADPANQQALRTHFGGVAPKPKLTLVIGRLPRQNQDRYAELQGRVSGVHMTTYDEVLEFRKIRIERMKALGI